MKESCVPKRGPNDEFSVTYTCLQTLEFFVSGRFLAKMQSRGVDLVNAQLLGYQEPGGGSSSPMPARPGPDGETQD